MSPQPVTLLSREEYLEIESAAEGRSEYIAGAMYAMSGATRNHNRMVSSISAELHGQLRGRDCEVTSTDLKLFIEPFDVFTYPDILVTCGPDKFLGKRQDVLTDAVLIIEVLSPSTKNDDRGEKFEFYRALPSFREYLLISPDRVRAEHHSRQADGSWLMREYLSLADDVRLAAIDCRLPLAHVYERVQFETHS